DRRGRLSAGGHRRAVARCLRDEEWKGRAMKRLLAVTAAVFFTAALTREPDSMLRSRGAVGECFACHALHGFREATRVRATSGTFLVTSVRPYAFAVAAIRPSMTGSGRRRPW